MKSAISTLCFSAGAFFCVAALLLSACSIKPGEVDPPQGHAADRFPHTYPDPSTEK